MVAGLSPKTRGHRVHRMWRRPGDFPPVALGVGYERGTPAPRPVGRGGHRSRTGGDGRIENAVDLIPDIRGAGQPDAGPPSRGSAIGRCLGSQVRSLSGKSASKTPPRRNPVQELSPLASSGQPNVR